MCVVYKFCENIFAYPEAIMSVLTNARSEAADHRRGGRSFLSEPYALISRARTIL